MTSAPTPSAARSQPTSPLRRRETCRLCGSTALELALSLAPSPPANAFVPPSRLDVADPVYPLDVWLCRQCEHAQLLDVVDPTVLFEDYVYASGTSPVFVRHFESYASEVAERVGLKPGDLVVDLGSNDGTLLRFFQQGGQRVLGVDPARDIARSATEAGIETLPEFFTPNLAATIRDRCGHARAITANNVFAHIDDLSSVTEGVRTLLATDGVFTFEVSYLVDVLQHTLFDTIYHEHLDYHALGPLLPFFQRHGLQLFDAARVPTHGGSLRGYAQHDGGPFAVQESVANLVRQEQDLRVGAPETFRAFGARIEALGRDLRELLERLRADGRRIAGFGAPAKATTLMHQFAIDSTILEFIVDDSPLKQGLFTPGTHVPVLPPSALYDERPDYVVVLAWNFAPSIIEKHPAFADAGGRFIIPVPELQVV